MKRWMAWLMAVVLMLTMLPAASLAAETATVKGGWLRLRAAASFDSTTIASYYTGTRVTVVARLNKWCQVITPDGRGGYMYSDYLTTGESSQGTGTVTSANGLPVRLRLGPGTGYGVIAKYSVGTKVTILSRGTYWHYVRIGNQTGYMMADYISGGTPGPAPTPAPSAGYTAWVTSANGKAVNLRSTPSKSNKAIGAYRVGTQVTVLEHGAVWDHVRVGTRTGYMMTEFLTTSQSPAVLTGASLSSREPVVGDKLAVKLTPENAAVTCQWYNDAGVLLASGDSYVVLAGDVGHKLRALVTGVGTTTGTVTTGYTSPVKAAPVPTPAPEKKEITGTVQLPTAVKVGVTIAPVVNVNVTDLVYQWYQNGVMVASGSTLTPTADMAGAKLTLIVLANGCTGEVKSGTCLVQSDATTGTDL